MYYRKLIYKISVGIIWTGCFIATWFMPTTIAEFYYEKLKQIFEFINVDV